MKHEGPWSRKYLAVAASLAAIAGLVAIAPWQVVAQQPSEADRAKFNAMKMHDFSAISPKLVHALQLNESQLNRIKVIHEAATRDIRRTLTQKQVAQLDSLAARQEGRKAEINLTDEQKQRLEAMSQELQAAAQSIKQDPGLTDEQKEEQLRALKQQHEDAFKQILTAEQLEAASRQHAEESHKNALNLTEDQARFMKELEEYLKDQARQIEEDTSLTPEQKEARLRDLKLAAHEKAMRILTPEQLKKAHEEHSVQQSGPYSYETLGKLADLTATQKKRIEAISQDAHKQLLATLTTAQRSKLKQLLSAQ